MKTYINYRIAIPEEQFDIAGAALSDTPLLGIAEGNDEITVCYEMPEQPEDFATVIIALLREYNCTPELRGAEAIEEQNWNAEWEASIEPVLLEGDAAIVPEWKKDEVSTSLKFVINPKMSFGTGHHATTRMMANAALRLIKPDSCWIDAGTGTGILAIIAGILGAKSVFAFDYDEWAVSNAAENITINGLSQERIRLEKADVRTVQLPLSDGIFANIHRNILEGCFARFRAALSQGGILLVSGLLRYDEEDMQQQAENADFQFIETKQDGEWIAMLFMAR